MKYGILNKMLQYIRNMYDDAKAGVNVKYPIT